MKVKDRIYESLPYHPTNDQEKLIHALERFTLSKKANPILIINGHAGTGKTSLIASYVQSLDLLRLKSRLMAPTGRAAKVFSSFAGKSASTIHRSIYFHSRDASGKPTWKRQENKSTNTVFIIDEASMISSQTSVSGSGFSYRTLLEDLIEYVFEKKGNKIVVLGDLAQLPPVGETESKALDPAYFDQFGIFPIALISLKEVVRQESGSAVLSNATLVRNMIDAGIHEYPTFTFDSSHEMEAVSGNELPEYIESAFDQVGLDNMIFITWSNKRANMFNQQIRARILWHEEEINAGDHIMIVKNNYFWLEENFIANGDVVAVQRVSKIEEMHELTFADLSIYFIDDPDQKTFDVKVILDVIMEDGPALSHEKSNKLFESVETDYMDVRSRAKRIKKVMEDPYFNALQIKFAYAVTGHKSQGGQWPVVFLEQPFIREALPSVEDLRWLYTGMTRSSKNLYLVNFGMEYFEQE